MKNIGALTKIKIHEIAKNQVNLRPNNAGIVDLESLAGTISQEIEFTQETASCKITEKETANGIITTITVEFKKPRILPNAYLDNLSKKYFVLEITDGNGRSYLIGNAETPVQSITSKIIPAKTSGYKGKSFKLVSIQSHDILYL